MPLTITCPMCRQAFPVPADVVSVDPRHPELVMVRVDRSELYGHLRECAAERGDQAGRDATDQDTDTKPGKALERPAPELVNAPDPVAKGARPCVMCGARADTCLGALAERPGTPPCCPSCGEGNTHPARHESIPCAEWPTHAAARH